MKFSKSWLQSYIDNPLPNDNDIRNVLNHKAFEVEEVIKFGNDTVFEIKVLPNRAHDALGHRAMARELSADLITYTFKDDKRILLDENILAKDMPAPLVAIDDEKACTRFVSVRIDGISVGKSPAWLSEKLEAIGQRSINNIVDITNYVQFSINKPMHAYDGRIIKGTLRARFAKTGEELTTLDDKQLKLDEKTLVIADDEKVLGLAGIKGGKYSGITKDTTSVILESANFAPTLARKTGERYNIKTDAGKRFENGIANSLAKEGLYMTINLIKELFPNAKVSEVTDIYPKEDTPYYVGISLSEVNAILGSAYDESEVETALKSLAFSFEKIIPKEYIASTYKPLVGAEYKNPSSMRYDAPKAFSCSSLVSYLYKGIWMPSISIDKYVFSEKIKEGDIRFGDLVFANTGEGKLYYESVEFLRGTKVPEGIDHVAMCLGDGDVIHATKVTGKVTVESLKDFATTRKIIGYGRIADDLSEMRYVIDVPNERLDLRTKEDLAEEIGRILGYERLKPILPKLNRTGLQHKRMFYENKIRQILLEKGFSEVMTYSFGNEGKVSIVKGLADDKEKLRETLKNGLRASLRLNLNNGPLLNEYVIKIFEFGNVFVKDKEMRYLGIGVDGKGKMSGEKEIKETVDGLEAFLGRKIAYTASGNIVEIDFDALIATLEEPKQYEVPSFAVLPSISYKPVSPYPFIARDIAMWVPSSVTWETIYALCGEVGNSLVVRTDLFDTFSKEIGGVKKTSYAFRLVFQSYEKTLTDEEVNKMMESYYEKFKEKGYEIR